MLFTIRGNVIVNVNANEDDEPFNEKGMHVHLCVSSETHPPSSFIIAISSL